MEAPYGSTLIANYAMVANRHMYDYGTTTEQLAQISVATRKHAMRNPEAVKAMTDLQFVKVDEITVEDVLESRIVADPLHLLECCMISDGGGAAVFVSADVARDIKKKPVWIIGSGEATKYRENGGDITTSAGAQSAPAAFAQAGVTPDEIDIAMIYDSFSITVAVCLEDLGFCGKGEIGPWIDDGHLAFDQPGLTLNTDGGGLSSESPRDARTLPAARIGPPAARRIDLAGRGCQARRRPRQRRTARRHPHRRHRNPRRRLNKNRPT